MNTEGVLKDLLPNNAVTTDKDGEKFYALPLPASELPLKLPEVENYQPSGTGESPLATISEWPLIDRIDQPIVWIDDRIMGDDAPLHSILVNFCAA